MVIRAGKYCKSCFATITPYFSIHSAECVDKRCGDNYDHSDCWHAWSNVCVISWQLEPYTKLGNRTKTMNFVV